MVSHLLRKTHSEGVFRFLSDFSNSEKAVTCQPRDVIRSSPPAHTYADAKMLSRPDRNEERAQDEETKPWSFSERGDIRAAINLMIALLRAAAAGHVNAGNSQGLWIVHLPLSRGKMPQYGCHACVVISLSWSSTQINPRTLCLLFGLSEEETVSTASEEPGSLPPPVTVEDMPENECVGRCSL